MAGMTWIIRTFRWHRRAVAAILAGLGALALVSHLSGSADAVSQVVVTTATVDAGSSITAADVALQPMSDAAVPADAITRLEDVVGRPAAVTLSDRTMVQPGMLVSGSAAAAGRALVPITVQDGQLRDLLSPGLRIALVSAGDAPGILTDDAVVHSMPPVIAASFGASGQAALVLVEVPSALAPQVSVLGQSGQLSVFLTG